ncbi:MAG: hypothetical protein KDD47_22300 [Acidobacteria bacterium]|nr:hypothetical protein [Acidobacteriota bacterium]
MAELDRLPAEDRLQEGLRDLAARRTTVSALWLAMAEPRLRAAGVEMPETDGLPEEREIAFYELLEGCEDPYYRYNSLRAELESLLSALEARKSRLRA